MSTLFRRSAIAIVDGVEIDKLRMEFKVTKTLKREPNTLDLSICNIAEGTRSRLQRRGAAVILMAGYQEGLAQVFSGDARTIDHFRKGSDWITRVQCGDGEKQYTFARVSESFGPGTRLLDAAERVARTLLGRDVGQEFRDLRALLSQTGTRLSVEQFAHGYSAHGRAAAEFDRLMQAAGLSWSIQDGQLVMLPKGRARATAARAPVLASDSGLIGSPEHGSPDSQGKPAPLKARCLLQPELRCGGVVEFQSLAVRGQFRIEKLTHSGATDAGPWFTDLECQPLPGTAGVAA